MTENEIVTLFIMLAILAPFLFVASVYSLRFYAASNKIQPDDLERFISQFWMPMRLLYTGSSRGMRSLLPKYTLEQIAGSLQTQRFLTCVLPGVFVLVSLLRIISDTLNGKEPALFYFILVAILSILLRAVLRLGHRIKSFPGSE